MSDDGAQLHEWTEWKFQSKTMICCKKCGIVRRPGNVPKGNDNKMCRGIVRVTLR